MAIQRKPLPAGDSDTQQPLPYPLTPQSPQPGPFNGNSSQSQPSALFQPQHPLHQTQSTGNVSDISDGWVDSGFIENEENRMEPKQGSEHNKAGQHLDAFPQTLMAGQHSNHSQASSLGSIPHDNGFERVERPGTNQSNVSNNPFHRSRGSDGQSRVAAPQSTFSSEIWTDIMTPQQSSSQNMGLETLSSDVSNLAISDQQPTQYAPYRPTQNSSGLSHLPPPTVEPETRQSFELPASPVNRDTAGQTNNQNTPDIWAQLDAAFEAPNKPSDEHSEQVWANAPIPVNPSSPSTMPHVSQTQQYPAMPPLHVEQKVGVNQIDSHQAQTPAGSSRQEFTYHDTSIADSEGPHPISSLDVEPPSISTATSYGKAHAAPESAKQAPFHAPPMTQEQKSETYPIKQIRWLDDASGELRTTPIMIQNANGPCPLLALVNALTLSTPAGLDTALVQTLRTREQVSLGFLLDAVFDELMSGRRGSAAQELPDVSELYAFLSSLHTGMNVNPQFIPEVQNTPLIEGLDSENFEESRLRQPGGFEDTREMMLYGTFSVQLVHGWLPPKRHPAFMALARSASTYEDAQNLMFREEELDDKLQRQGLNSDEQQLLQDIVSIKAFLHSSATQLTGYGLDVIADTLAPGSIAILFRNDHFSTIYKHPRSGQLLSLVTDYGYASHAEIVWESLVDVSGEACEFYSGDFRPVGNSTAYQQAQGDNWDNGNQAPIAPSGSAMSTEDSASAQRNTEQEDADLALAMQLQEEEDDRQRRADETRRAQERASQAWLSNAQPQQGGAGQAPRSDSAQRNRASSGRPSPSPALAPGSAATGRRQSNVPAARLASSNPPLPARREASQPSAPLPVRRNPNDPEAGEDAPPPTYEQAAKAAPYTGPVPAPGAGVGSSSAAESYAQMRASNGAQRDYYTRPRGQSAYSQSSRGNFPATASGSGQVPSPDAARRRASGAAMASYENAVGNLSRRSTGERERERDKDCVIM